MDEASADADVATLFARYYLSLVRLAIHLVDDLESAEDVVQDVFARLPGATIPAEPLPYLRTAVLNRSRSLLRRRRVARLFTGRSTVLDAVEGADENALRVERRARLLAEIASLPLRQREVVVLRFYEDLRVAEIGDALGISPAAVSSSLNRALDRLRARSVPDGDDDD